MTVSPSLSRDGILAAVREAVAAVVPLSAADLGEDTRLLDLDGMTSAKVVRVATRLEDSMGVTLVSESAAPWHTVKDAVDAVSEATAGR
ncbi:phosphopantetheine-binding protein [Streptomyces niveiscabiei]|uniref:phosphopantetheine-binding protein n=1 Tax=Streptomyces niveiscabiei TaxID=164115 RepID=UPI0029AF3DDD|nr:phosphopantetheine-binding protein [Streptomyces niveiscabiei]MDX3386045.1 phosphopantetheine-binding protein [Streptomyces niveiscabiei]